MPDVELPPNGFSKWVFRIVSALVPIAIVALVVLYALTTVHSSQITKLSEMVKDNNTVMAQSLKDNTAALATSIKDIAATVDKLNASGTSGLAVERAERIALGERVTRNEGVMDSLVVTLGQINGRLAGIEITQARTETLLRAHMEEPQLNQGARVTPR